MGDTGQSQEMSHGEGGVSNVTFFFQFLSYIFLLLDDKNSNFLNKLWPELILKTLYLSMFLVHFLHYITFLKNVRSRHMWGGGGGPTRSSK